MSSMTAADNNRPLGERYHPAVYPVTTVQQPRHIGSPALSWPGGCKNSEQPKRLPPTPTPRPQRYFPQEASYASALAICTVFSTKQIILSGGFCVSVCVCESGGVGGGQDVDVVLQHPFTTIAALRFTPLELRAETDVEDFFQTWKLVRVKFYCGTAGLPEPMGGVYFGSRSAATL